MPHGHPEPLPYGDRPDNYNDRNNAAMVKEINHVLISWIESRYRVAETPSERAIAGLSMGGGHSIRTALGTNKFGWVGAFSAAAPEDESVDSIAVDLSQFRKQNRLFWIACGDEDFLLDRNQSFDAALTDANVSHQYLETKGSHNWNVWRDEYLPQFLPLLFTE